MYKILLVDDERIIRESISSLIDWETYGFELIGTAKHGIEAYDIILREHPDLVITDLKMPVMSGIQLIEKVKMKYPEIEFAILSGHSEFKLAKETMKHGVKHYLLKPCDEKDLIHILEEVRSRLKLKEKREDFIKKNNEKLEKIIPLVKEQFIRDFIMSRHYNQDELDYFMNLFNVKNKRIRVIILQPVGDFNFNTLFALLNIVKRQTFQESIYFKTTVNKSVLLIVENLEEKQIEEFLNEIMENFKYLADKDLVTTYTREGDFDEVSVLFQKAQDYLNYAFYLGNSCIISYKDIEKGMQVNELDSIDLQEIVTTVKSGNSDLFNQKITEYFDHLSKMRFDISTFKFYCIELASAILRQCQTDKANAYIQKLLEIQLYDSFEQTKEEIIKIGNEVVAMNYSGIIHRHNEIVENMLRIIDEHIDQEELSLKWIANELLYMNSGYLSKLFSKEMDENFSQYLMRRRMEKAKEVIEQSASAKVYEIASKVGMGNNPQYFSQLFKRHTGMTPSEYKNQTMI